MILELNFRLKSVFCTQDIEIVVPAAFPCTVRCPAAVSASVCNLGSIDLKETAMRYNFVASVKQ